MERAGSGFGGDQNLTASRPPIASVIVAALQSEFLNGVYVRRVDDRAVGARVVDIGSIDGPVVGIRAGAVYRHRGVAGAGLIAHLADHTGLQSYQLLEVAASEFELANLHAIDGAGLRAGLRFD